MLFITAIGETKMDVLSVESVKLRDKIYQVWKTTWRQAGACKQNISDCFMAIQDRLLYSPAGMAKIPANGILSSWTLKGICTNSFALTQEGGWALPQSRMDWSSALHSLWVLEAAQLQARCLQAESRKAETFYIVITNL